MLELSSFFLGPGAENAGALERLVRVVLDGHIAFRRRLHPGGAAAASPGTARISEHELLLTSELRGLLAQLGDSVPFFSPRHLGHMASDVTLASLVGYLATLLHNPNNVSPEGGPVTSRLEGEVVAQLSAMLGYTGTGAWGHLTSGGTIANLESLWAARMVRSLPLTLRWVAEDEGQGGLVLQTARGERRAIRELSLWELLNLPVAASIEAALALGIRLGAAPSNDPRVARHLLSQLGSTGFMRRVEERFGTPLPPELVLAPATAHYSWKKSCRVLGLGADGLKTIPVDSRFRMDLVQLEASIRELAARGQPVLACIPVVGSTEQGAVDPVQEIVALRRRLARELGVWFWLHADAAWGGYAASAVREAGPVPSKPASTPWPPEDVASALRALGEVDSITVDPHKYGFAPFPAGALCYRDGRVRFLISTDAPYAFQDEAAARASTGSHTLEGSRPGAAAAGVWLSHRMLPLDREGHGRLIHASALGARRLHRMLETREWAPFRITLLPVPDLNVVCFALSHPGFDTLEEDNAFVSGLYEALSFGAGRKHEAPEYIVSQTVLRPSLYGDAVLPIVEQLGFSKADALRAGGVHLLRCTVMHPFHAEARPEPDHLQGFVDRLHALSMEHLADAGAHQLAAVPGATTRKASGVAG